MENSNTPTPILQLRQDDVVTIPLERYAELIDFETRLGMLRKMRYTEVAIDKSSYIRSEDYVLGGTVLELLIHNQEAEAQKRKAADE